MLLKVGQKLNLAALGVISAKSFIVQLAFRLKSWSSKKVEEKNPKQAKMP